MDFVADALSHGRRFRILTLIACYSRESLAMFADYSLPSRTVTDVLDRVIARRGAPKMITTDNGPEFTSHHYHEWAFRKKIQFDYIRPGKPTENGFIESFNGKLRDECAWTRAGSARCKKPAPRSKAGERSTTKRDPIPHLEI